MFYYSLHYIDVKSCGQLCGRPAPETIPPHFRIEKHRTWSTRRLQNRQAHISRRTDALLLRTHICTNSPLKTTDTEQALERLKKGINVKEVRRANNPCQMAKNPLYW